MHRNSKPPTTLDSRWMGRRGWVWGQMTKPVSKQRCWPPIKRRPQATTSDRLLNTLVLRIGWRFSLNYILLYGKDAVAGEEDICLSLFEINQLLPPPLVGHMDRRATCPIWQLLCEIKLQFQRKGRCSMVEWMSGRWTSSLFAQSSWVSYVTGAALSLNYYHHYHCTTIIDKARGPCSLVHRGAKSILNVSSRLFCGTIQ